MEQIKEFEKRMDAALDHIAVHLKSSPQAGEKKDHAVAELDLLKAENTALKSELDALAEPKIANDNQEIGVEPRQGGRQVQEGDDGQGDPREADRG